MCPTWRHDWLGAGCQIHGHLFPLPVQEMIIKRANFWAFISRKQKWVAVGGCPVGGKKSTPIRVHLLHWNGGGSDLCVCGYVCVYPYASKDTIQVPLRGTVRQTYTRACTHIHTKPTQSPTHSHPHTTHFVALLRVFWQPGLGSDIFTSSSDGVPSSRTYKWFWKYFVCCQMKIIGRGIHFMPGIFTVPVPWAHAVISRPPVLSVLTRDTTARKAILYAACLEQLTGPKINNSKRKDKYRW